MAAKRGSFFVEVENGPALRRALKKAEIDLKELSAINKRVATIVANRAKEIAPVGHERNGHIRTTVRPGATQRAGIVRVGNKSKPYAGVINMGWRAHNVTKVRPWVFQAAKETEPIWLEQYYREITDIIERIG